MHLLHLCNLMRKTAGSSPGVGSFERQPGKCRTSTMSFPWGTMPRSGIPGQLMKNEGESVGELALELGLGFPLRSVTECARSERGFSSKQVL